MESEGGLLHIPRRSLRCSPANRTPGTDYNLNQRSLRDSTIFHGVCVGEMLVLKAICDALTPAYLIKHFGNRTQSNTNCSIAELNRT